MSLHSTELVWEQLSQVDEMQAWSLPTWVTTFTLSSDSGSGSACPCCLPTMKMGKAVFMVTFPLQSAPSGLLISFPFAAFSSKHSTLHLILMVTSN